MKKIFVILSLSMLLFSCSYDETAQENKRQKDALAKTIKVKQAEFDSLCIKNNQ